jgi:hypothetical protein
MKKMVILLAPILILPSTVLMSSANDRNVQKSVNSAIADFQDKGQDRDIVSVSPRRADHEQ